MIRSRIFGVGAPLLALAMAAHAGSYTFATSAGAKESTGNAVSASAAITTGTGTVTITLSNLFVNQVTVAQNISDFAFTLSGTTSLGSLGANTGQEITVTGPGSTLGGTVTTGWAFTSPSSGSYLLNVLGTGIGPAHTIIGAPGGSGYTNANGSIAGNASHNPFLNQTASFTLNIAGVTTGTTVNSATFSFGTAEGNNVSGCLVGGPSCTSVTTPEPISLSLVGGGLLALGLLRKRLPRA